MDKSNESSLTGSTSTTASSSDSAGSGHASSSSDSEDTSSEEFFDAEEPNTGTLIQYTRKLLDNRRDRIDLSTLTPAQVDSGSSDSFFLTPPQGVSAASINVSTFSGDNSILSKSELEEEEEEDRRRKRLDEMRKRLNNDEVEEHNQDDQTSPSDSQTSSVEGLYGAICGRTSHPFKVVDHDSVSMQSGVSIGGRLGRMPGNAPNSGTVPFGSSTVPSGQLLGSNVYHNNPLPPHHQPFNIQPSLPHSSGFSTSTNTSYSTVSHPVPNVHPMSTIQPQPTTLPLTNNNYNNSTATPSSNISSNQVPLYATTRSISEELPESDGSIVNNNITAPEPDLVSSCTAKNLVSSPDPGTKVLSVMSAPVAPPRRKRRGLLDRGVQSEEACSSKDCAPSKDNLSGSSWSAVNPTSASNRPTSVRHDSSSSVNTIVSPTPPSPTVSIRSISRELDKTLESNNQKIFVVKAQDEEKTRAKNSGPKALRRTESLPKDVLAAFAPSGNGSGGCRDSASNSSTLTSGVNSEMANEPASETDHNSTEVSSALTPPAVSTIVRSSKNSRSNSAPKASSNQLSAMISAMAAMEEQKDHENQLSLMIRTRTGSGKLLSDIEILEQVQVLNLDTGEKVPLSIAEDKIPQCINPLSLHIMRLTSEYIGNRNNKERDSDEESVESKKSSAASQEDGESGVRKKTAQVRRFIGSTVKKTVDKAKSLAQRKHVKEDVDISTNDDDPLGGGTDPLVKMKASHSHKGPYDFDHLQQVQDLSGEHVGPVWCMKFSNCGRLLATAGQDKTIRIWVLKDHLPYFQDMRTKNTSDKVSPTPSQESIVSQLSHHSAEEMIQACENSDPKSPFVPRPLCTYSGHSADLLDMAWSKSFFLLSSSMDRTVRLWHISRRECLCCFQHVDFVTAIVFHPRDDRYFLSGSLDGKLRLWNIPDKKVALWNEVNGPNKLITAANFCSNGKFAVVGTYDGRCIFYHTEQLKYHTQIIVHRRKRLAGKKITGIEPMPGEDKILVTSNDSRIRLYDLRDLSLTCKYKGFTNSSSQIKGTVSHDGKYIVSGSENQCVYIWKTNHDYSKFSSARRDRNGYWEGIKAHKTVVTCAVFAPDPDIIVRQIEKKEEQEASKQPRTGMVKSPSLTKSGSQSNAQSSTCPAGYILVSADFSGCIKVFFCKVKPKHSSLPASALV